MESIPLAVWLPIATLILGYAFSLFTEAFRDRRQTRREREARAVEWRVMKETWHQERVSRRREYDRGTFTELQDALNDFIAVCGDAYGARLDALSQDERWSWSNELRLRYLNGERTLMTLTSRVADAKVRELITTVKKRSGPLMLAQDFDRADDAFADIQAAAEQALTRLGELIRGTL